MAQSYVYGMTQLSVRNELREYQQQINNAYYTFVAGMDDLINELYENRDFTDKNFSTLRTKLRIVADMLESSSIQA